jgi:hypothetical protein
MQQGSQMQGSQQGSMQGSMQRGSMQQGSQMQGSQQQGSMQQGGSQMQGSQSNFGHPQGPPKADMKPGDKLGMSGETANKSGMQSGMGGQGKFQQGQMSQKQKGERGEMMTEEEEAVNRLIKRFNKFLKKISQKKEYQDLVENFFNYSDQLYCALVDVTDKAQRSPEAKQIQELLDQSFEFLADIVGKDLVEKYREDFRTLFNELKDDQELKKWREDIRSHVRAALKNPEVDEDKAKEEYEKVKKFMTDGRKIFEKYRENMNVLYEDNLKIAKRVRDDPTIKEFEENLKKLGSRLVLNERGQFEPMVLQESLSQITDLVARLLHKYLASFPFSKLEIHSPDYDVCLTDIKVEGSGLAPETMEIKTYSHSLIALAEGKQSQSRLEVTFRVANIHPHFKDFHYHINHKSFPAYEDSGRGSVECAEGGLDISATLMFQTRGNLPTKAYLKWLSVKLGRLDITTQEEEHGFMAYMLAPYFAATVRSRLESTIDQMIRSRLDDIVVQINDFFASHPVDKMVEKTKEVAMKASEEVASQAKKLEKNIEKGAKHIQQEMGEKQKGLRSDNP